MKKVVIASIAGAVLLCAAGATAYLLTSSPNVELGAIKLGMPASDYKAIVPSYGAFEVGGITAMSDPKVTFRQGKLDTFQMAFGTYNYVKFRDAIKAKYPRMKCEQVKADKYIEYDFERCRIGETLIVVQGHQGDNPQPSNLWLMSEQANADEMREYELMRKASDKKL
jgi:hypothetical protein